MKQTAYIFDVDGVLNDLKVYEPDTRIIAHMVRLLRSGAYVAINTGRGYAWIEEHVVKSIQDQIDDKEALSRFFVAVEMGGLGVEFGTGTAQHVKSAFSLPQEEIDVVKQTFENKPEYATVMHWYAKESMATLAKNYDTPLEDFVPYQKTLTDELKVIFDGKHVKVANSTDAVDVHSPEAGKWAGAELVYEWLRANSDVQHERFVCFGDSGADFDMARFFGEQSHDAVFVCTNPDLELPESTPNITIHRTNLPFHVGTNEYLEQNTL